MAGGNCKPASKQRCSYMCSHVCSHTQNSCQHHHGQPATSRQQGLSSRAPSNGLTQIRPQRVGKGQQGVKLDVAVAGEVRVGGQPPPALSQELGKHLRAAGWAAGAGADVSNNATACSSMCVCNKEQEVLQQGKDKSMQAHKQGQSRTWFQYCRTKSASCRGMPSWRHTAAASRASLSTAQQRLPLRG